MAEAPLALIGPTTAVELAYIHPSQAGPSAAAVVVEVRSAAAVADEEPPTAAETLPIQSLYTRNEKKEMIMTATKPIINDRNEKKKSLDYEKRGGKRN